MADEKYPWWDYPGAPGENRTREQYAAEIAALKEPNPNRKPLLTGAARLFYELWQSAERDNSRERFEQIIESLNYDGDTDSLTVGEIRRALP